MKLIRPALTLLSLSALLPASLPAETALPLSLTVRRDMPYGGEQVSLVFREKHVELVLNSNFVGPRSGVIRLGLFRAERNAELDEIRDLVSAEDLKLRRRAEFKAGTEISGAVPRPAAPHQRKMLVGTQEVLDGGTQEELGGILRSVQSSVAWTAVDGVEIEDAGEGKLRIRPVGKNATPERVVPLTEVPCDVQPEARDYCQIRGYGGIYRE